MISLGFEFLGKELTCRSPKLNHERDKKTEASTWYSALEGRMWGFLRSCAKAVRGARPKRHRPLRL